ncbi:hypothetical protein [Nocardioides sp.]|jgi:hypothetical protein|uniref:hypothetical protein n=1 Tax=Nocardioides sp. TaxID=35761 RepID=UPI00260C291D|nr:hypothetical protein [Nocardioides sp.]
MSTTSATGPMPGTPAPVDDRRRRELLGSALWAAAALAWTIAMLVPWFRAGALSHLSPIEAGGALRTGLVGIPSAAGFVVLLLPLASWVLLALAPARGRLVLAWRILLWLASTVVGLGLVVLMASVSADTYGWGAGLVVVACVLGAGGLCCSTLVRAEEAEEAQEAEG